MISMDKKYRTRDGRDVRLLCVDGPMPYPVIALIDGAITAAAFTSLGAVYSGSEDSDLIEYHEPDIRTIWVNVYETHVVKHPNEREAKILATDAAISIAQPVTFEVERS